MTKIHASSLTNSLAICLVIAISAFASDEPPRASERLLSDEGGLTMEEIRKLVEEGAEQSSELAQIVRGLEEPSLGGCNEQFFRDLMEKREQHLDHLPLVRYLTDAMRRQRKWCEDHFESEMNRRVGEFSPRAQKFFELFVMHDLVGHDFYRSPDNSINKLRELSEGAEVETREEFERQFGRDFFDACREINGLLEELEITRREHEKFAKLPRNSDHYFRANSFCKNLVGFDLLDAINDILFRNIKSRNTLIKFGRYLSADGEINFQVASDAALDYAADFEFELRKRPESEKEEPLRRRQKGKVRQVLSDLRATCDITLEKLENIIWLIQFAGLQPEQLTLSDDESHQLRVQKYLRTVSACQQIPTLNIDNLLHRHQKLLIDAKWRQTSVAKRALTMFIKPWS